MHRFDRPIMEPIKNYPAYATVWHLMGFLLLAGLIFALYKLLSRSKHFTSIKSDPISLAKERYARGEITKDELMEIKKELLKD